MGWKLSRLLLRVRLICEKKKSNPRSCDVTIWCLGKEDNTPRAVTAQKNSITNGLKSVEFFLIRLCYLSEKRRFVSRLRTVRWRVGKGKWVWTQVRHVRTNAETGCKQASWKLTTCDGITRDTCWDKVKTAPPSACPAVAAAAAEVSLRGWSTPGCESPTHR